MATSGVGVRELPEAHTFDFIVAGPSRYLMLHVAQFGLPQPGRLAVFGVIEHVGRFPPNICDGPHIGICVCVYGVCAYDALGCIPYWVGFIPPYEFMFCIFMAGCTPIPFICVIAALAGFM